MRLLLAALVLLYLATAALLAWGHGPIPTSAADLDPDETRCVCSRVVIDGMVDACATGQSWDSLLVDPPTIVRIVRQQQAVQRMREKLAQPATPP